MHFAVIINWYRSIAGIQFKLDTKIKMEYSKIKNLTSLLTQRPKSLWVTIHDIIDQRLMKWLK